MTGPEGNSEFCFPRISMFPEIQHILYNIFYMLYSKTKQNKTNANFEKRVEIPGTTLGHLQLHALITCNSGQNFAGNSELFHI